MEKEISKLMPDILEMAKKLPKGSKMEIAMPTKKGEAKEGDEDGTCPHCGGPMHTEAPVKGKKAPKESADLRKLLED